MRPPDDIDSDPLQLGPHQKTLVALEPHRRWRSWRRREVLDNEVARRFLLLDGGRCRACGAPGALVSAHAHAPLCWDCFLQSRGAERRSRDDYRDDSIANRRRYRLQDTRTERERRNDKKLASAIKRQVQWRGKKGVPC